MSGLELHNPQILALVGLKIVYAVFCSVIFFFFFFFFSREAMLQANRFSIAIFTVNVQMSSILLFHQFRHLQSGHPMPLPRNQITLIPSVFQMLEESFLPKNYVKQTTRRCFPEHFNFHVKRQLLFFLLILTIPSSLSIHTTRLIHY